MWAQLISFRLKPGRDEDRQKRLEPVRATMAKIFDGSPQFVDLTVVEDYAP